MTRRARLERVKGEGGWYVRLVAANGETLMHSETYASASNASRGEVAALRACAEVMLRAMESGALTIQADDPLERAGTALGAPNSAEPSVDTQDGGSGAERGAGDE